MWEKKNWDIQKHIEPFIKKFFFVYILNAIEYIEELDVTLSKSLLEDEDDPNNWEITKEMILKALILVKKPNLNILKTERESFISQLFSSRYLHGDIFIVNQ